MITQAEASPVTLEWWNRLGPWAAADSAGYLLTLLESIGYQHQVTEDYIRDTPTQEGWSVLLDPDACPPVGLPWLSQFAGSPIPVGTSDADARALIRSGNNRNRGTAAFIVAAVKPYLSGGQHVRIVERTAADGTADPYRLRVVTYLPETPGGAAGAVAAMVKKVLGLVVPGGLVFSYSVDAGPEINQLVGTIGAQVEVHISSYADETPV